MRLPDAVASLPLARAVLNLFASVWERRYEHVYSRGETLFNLAQQGDFAHTEVVRVLTTLVTAFIGECRFRYFPVFPYYYMSSRVFPKTYSRLIVQSLYDRSIGARSGIPWSARRRTPFWYVPNVNVVRSLRL